MKKVVFLFVLLFAVSRCSLDFPPEDEVSDPDAITSIIAGKRALASAYASYDEYNYALDMVVLSDDMQETSLLAKNPDLKNTYRWKGEQLESLAEMIWKGHYETIAKANVVLERIEKLSVGADKQEELKQLKAQAKYLKALCYFQLLKIFSPDFTQKDATFYGLLLKERFVLTENQGRVSLEESVKAIQQLLENIKNTDTDVYWITDDAAKYLQAELALWIGDYQKAIDFAYPLYEKYFPVLEKENPSAIWTNKPNPLQLFVLDIENLNRRIYENLEYSQTVGDYLEVSPAIEYGANDIRKGVYTVPFTRNIGNGEEHIFHLGKYKEQGKKETVNYYTKFRVAGLVFLCAEAYLKHKQKDKAIQILNTFLAVRKSDTVISTINDDMLLDRILTEKQREFVGEPERFFDLKRNNKSMTKKTSLSTFTIAQDDYRWTLPIPSSEIKYNKAVIQNKGWEYINDIK